MDHFPVTAARALIDTAKTLVLSTADPEPWAAPVYYVYADRRFWFFSSPDSRHITAARENAAAAAVFRDSDDWRQIEGLQMEGTVAVSNDGPQAASVLTAYLAKFPTVRDFFDDGAIDVARFTQQFHTQLYAFAPLRVFYLNNQAGLGKRREIDLTAAPDDAADQS